MVRGTGSQAVSGPLPLWKGCWKRKVPWHVPRLAGVELRLQIVVSVERTFCDRTESRKAFSSRWKDCVYSSSPCSCLSLSFFLSPLLLLIGKGSRRIREQSRWKCNLRLFPAMTVNCLGRWIDCLGLKQIRTPGVFWCWIIWSLRTNLKKGFSVHARIGGDKRRVKD